MLLKIAIEKNYSCLFVPFSELVILNTKLMTGWNNPNLEKAIEEIKNVDFLVLDDLAKEYDSNKDNGRATLNSIIRFRDLWKKPVIYTSNIPISEISDKYGASNSSIIQSRSILVYMKNDLDIRQRNKYEKV